MHITMPHPYKAAGERQRALSRKRDEDKKACRRADLEALRTASAVYLWVHNNPKVTGRTSPYARTYRYYDNGDGKCYNLSVDGLHWLEFPRDEIPPAFWFRPVPGPDHIDRGRMIALRMCGHDRNAMLLLREGLLKGALLDVELDNWVPVPTLQDRFKQRVPLSG